MSSASSTISICMGSSCYARGNARNVEIIRRWLAREGLEARIEFSGTLCEGLCRDGPNLRIGEKLYKGVDPAAIEDILQHELGGQ
ncbi:MAG: (2Fe-2S) ferredoxin domain-containing protein [Spirochaetia bacterium]|jgi:NADH:ubiquinone oxidoreductase subunit E|nr:(2Fe-2S) ferredoxin domain-containing protein [Spirochaetia bacterium]